MKDLKSKFDDFKKKYPDAIVIFKQATCSLPLPLPQ